MRGQSGQGSLDQGLEVGRSWSGLEKFLQGEPAVGKWLEATLGFSLSDLRAFSKDRWMLCYDQGQADTEWDHFH